MIDHFVAQRLDDPDSPAPISAAHVGSMMRPDTFYGERGLSYMFAFVAAVMLGGCKLGCRLNVPPPPFKGQVGLSAQDSKSDFPQLVIYIVGDNGAGFESTRQRKSPRVSRA